MSDLSSQTREVLRLARSARVLSDERKSAHKAALYARLGLGAALITTKAAATGVGWFATLGPAKVIIGAALLAGSTTVGYVAFNSDEARVPDSAPSANVFVVPAPELESAPAPERPLPKPVTEPARVKRSPAAPRAAITHVDNNSLLEETRLIRDSDRALRAGDARAAMKLLDQHAKRFPNGALAPERAAERLLAGCVLGSASTAQAENFIRKNPGSPLTARLKQACDAKKR